MFNSCCDSGITATNGFGLFFNDESVIEKVELLGAGKTILVNRPSASLTLNPSDTISSYYIFYKNNQGRDSAILTIIYSAKVSLNEYECNSERDLDVVYKVRNITSTFSSAVLGNSSYSNQIYVAP